MNKLPIDIQNEFFKLFDGVITIEYFESWIYEHNELERYLEKEDYLEFISLDFKDTQIIKNIKELLHPYLKFGENQEGAISKKTILKRLLKRFYLIDLYLVKTSITRLEDLMRGCNFQVTLGIAFFNDCNSIDAFKILLRDLFPGSRPDNLDIIEVERAFFWKHINDSLKYRGDKSIASYIDEENYSDIDIEQEIYIDFLSRFLKEKSRIFVYPDNTGIPGYDVWWSYRYIILNEKRQGLFIYGSASD